MQPKINSFSEVLGVQPATQTTTNNDPSNTLSVAFHLSYGSNVNHNVQMFRIFMRNSFKAQICGNSSKLYLYIIYV